MRPPDKRREPQAGKANGSLEIVYAAADSQELSKIAARLQQEAARFLADRRHYRRLEARAVSDARDRIFGRWEAA